MVLVNRGLATLYGSVIAIFNGHLDMKKLSTRWVPNLLTIYQKQKRVIISKKYFAFFNCNPDLFLCSLR